MARAVQMARAAPANLACWGSDLLFPSTLCAFLKKVQPLQSEALPEPPEWLCFPIRWAYRLLGSIPGSGGLLFPRLQMLDHHTTRQVMKSTGGDFLNALHGYYISCV